MKGLPPLLGGVATDQPCRAARRHPGRSGGEVPLPPGRERGRCPAESGRSHAVVPTNLDEQEEEQVELGVYTFGDVARDPRTGTTISPEQRVTNLLEEIELADQVGLDVFGVGEHHRRDYAVSAPAVVLGAAAVKTKQIKLSSAVTVL